jgi:hypothetical protein
LEHIESNAFATTQPETLFIPRSAETFGDISYSHCRSFSSILFEFGSNLKRIHVHDHQFNRL